MEFFGRYALSIQYPWFVGRDFNIIINNDENIGGFSITTPEMENFKHCINICILQDSGFKRSKYTW